MWGFLAKLFHKNTDVLNGVWESIREFKSMLNEINELYIPNVQRNSRLDGDFGYELKQSYDNLLALNKQSRIYIDHNLLVNSTDKNMARGRLKFETEKKLKIMEGRNLTQVLQIHESRRRRGVVDLKKVKLINTKRRNTKRKHYRNKTKRNKRRNKTKRI